MVLNKLCFRGIFREGPNGFNVPFGHYKKTPTIITYNDLNVISELIQPVEFICCDYKESFDNLKNGDFMYIDPPYVPEKVTSFVGYTSHGFNLQNHMDLFKHILELKNKDIKFTLCNSNVPLVIETFENYKIQKISARRAIHSKKPQTKTTEVIIT
jgi:DNA adenine methylase